MRRYTHSYRGPITKEDNRVPVRVKVPIGKCVQNQGKLLPTNYKQKMDSRRSLIAGVSTFVHIGNCQVL